MLPAPGAVALLGSDKETQAPALESALEIEREIELCKRNPGGLRLPAGLAGGFDTREPLEQIESKFSVLFEGQGVSLLLQTGTALLSPRLSDFTCD